MTAQSIPNTVRIFVGAGLSFEVPRGYYDEALLMATLQRKVWYVGLTRRGVEVGPSHAELVAKGCGCIGWICPASKILASGVRVTDVVAMLGAIFLLAMVLLILGGRGKR